MKLLNQKGQAGLAMAVIVAVIGLIVLNGFTAPFCTCTDATNNETLLNGTAVDMCEGETLCELDSIVCNDTTLTLNTLAVLGDYDADDCSITLVNNTWNDTSCQATYSYEGDTYESGILGTIICMLPVLVALGIMVLAVGMAII